jgi:hypothetical protein
LTNYALAKCAPTVCSLSFVAFVSNLNAESIINTWNCPAKTKMESNKRREGMYNIIDFQLMGGLSEHTNGGPGRSMSNVVGSNNSHTPITNIYQQHVYPYNQVKQGQ